MYGVLLGVAYDSQRDVFYWTTEGDLQQFTRGPNPPSSLTTQVTSPVCVTLDYIGQRLFWIENKSVVCLVCLPWHVTMNVHVMLIHCHTETCSVHYVLDMTMTVIIIKPSCTTVIKLHFYVCWCFVVVVLSC